MIRSEQARRWAFPALLAGLVLASTGSAGGLDKATLDQALVETAKLLATEATDLDQFGYGVDIAGDFAIVSGNFRDNPDNSRGVAYIFHRTGPGQWQRVIQLEPFAEAERRQFGSDAAIDGDIAVVGAYQDFQAGNLFGAVFFFHRNAGGPDNWGLEFVYERTSFAERQSYLGLDVDVSGNYAIAGAQRFPGGGTAFVFRRNGPNDWDLVAQLTPAGETQFFGSGVAIDGNTAVVGARNNNSGESGTVHIFERDVPSPDGWGEVRELSVPTIEPLGSAVAISDDLVVAAGPSCTQGVESGVIFFRKDLGGTDNWGIEKQILDLPCGTGTKVAVEDDLVVYGDDFPLGFPRVGELYVLRRNEGGPNNWGQSQLLTPAIGNDGDMFGSALGLDDGRLIVGAIGDDESGGSFAGAAYVFEAGPGTGEEDLEDDLAPDAGDRLGSAVAVQGNLIAVGSPGADDGAADAGTVEILRREGETFVREATLTAPSPEAAEAFGSALALEGGVLVIGAPATGAAKGNGSQLQAYIFERLGQTWTYKQAVASDVPGGDDEFGSSIALEGNQLVIGAPGDAGNTGAIHSFAFDGSSWSTVARTGPTGGQAGDRFGSALALKDQTLIAGAPGTQIAGQVRGSAALYGLVAGNLQALDSIDGSMSGAGAEFGAAVAFDGTTMAVGAPGEGSNTGATYRFAFTGSTATEQARIVAEDGGAGARFGAAVAVDGDRLAVGAAGGAGTPGRGYLFGVTSGQQLLSASREGSAAGDRFGTAVALDGELVLFGTPGADAEAGGASVIFDTDHLFRGDFE